MSLDDLQVRGLPVGQLPLIRACLDKLGVFETLDEHLPQHPLAHASDAECLAVMVLNILSGRVALWRMDHIDGVGTDTLVSDVCLRFVHQEPA